MFRFWTVLAGILVIGFALREIFKDLFSPSGSGALSSYIGRTIFGVARRSRFMMPAAGPLVLVAVISCWTFLLALGFAMVYWASFPAEFLLNPPAPGSRFVGALYFSFESLTTLGLGDIIPKSDWIRVVSALEALLGLSLVTASITWIVLIYPALGRLRTLARYSSILFEAEENFGIELISENSEALIGELTVDLIRTRVDFLHYPIIYYFHTRAEKAALAYVLPNLMRLAEAGVEAKSAERVRLASAALRTALNDLASLISDRFLTTAAGDPASVFKAYAHDHLLDSSGERPR